MQVCHARTVTPPRPHLCTLSMVCNSVFDEFMFSAEYHVTLRGSQAVLNMC